MSIPIGPYDILHHKASIMHAWKTEKNKKMLPKNKAIRAPTLKQGHTVSEPKKETLAKPTAANFKFSRKHNITLSQN